MPNHTDWHAMRQLHVQEDINTQYTRWGYKRNGVNHLFLVMAQSSSEPTIREINLQELIPNTVERNSALSVNSKCHWISLIRGADGELSQTMGIFDINENSTVLKSQLCY